MRLFRLGDWYMQKHSFFKAHNDSVDVHFISFGKGEQRCSNFEVKVDLHDIVCMISDLSFAGNPDARKIEAFLRGHDQFQGSFKLIDGHRARELEEEAAFNLKRQLERD